MKSISDPLSEQAIGRLLVEQSLRGRWRIEEFDQPPPAARELLKTAQREAIKANRQPPVWRNLAREWMAANPYEWDQLLRQSLDTERTDLGRDDPQSAAAATVNSFASI
jgi:hypothetical protein